MSTMVDPSVSPPTQIDGGRRPTTGSGRRHFFTWRDLVIPLVVAIAVGAEVYYLNTAKLSQIVESQMTFDRISDSTIEHVKLAFAVTALVLVASIPVGIAVTRVRLLEPFALLIANAGQAVPSIGLVAIVALVWEIGFWPVVISLTLFAVLPVLRNTIVGLDQIDPDIKDAARGMGMSPAGVLFRVELPLAVPVIAAGARTALVLAVATIPIGYFIGAGGLGDQLMQGIKLSRNQQMFAAALFVACLALILDWLGGIVERVLTPAGIR
ncbi:MAG TPA: ABC transporter permease [Nocardioidaceae bacterium]|nr:ABC transporter permease [Nocardioidaceae bacterium]